MADKLTGLDFPAVFTEELADVVGRRRESALATQADRPTLQQRANTLERRQAELVDLVKASTVSDALANGSDPAPSKPPSTPPANPVDGCRLVGLAISGGGIRSATFNLGVLQELHRAGAFAKVDYLSTVSGGGYIGSCLTSYFSAKPSSPPPAGQPVPTPPFPFRHTAGVRESLEFVHLREHANYLAPRGFLDLLVFPALFLKGILVNLLVVSWVLLLAAVLSVVLWGLRIKGAAPGEAGLDLLSFSRFFFTLWVIKIFLLLVVLSPLLQALYSSAGLENWRSRTWLFRMLGFFIAAVGVTAFIEVQPYCIWKFSDWGINFKLSVFLEQSKAAYTAIAGTVGALSAVAFTGHLARTAEGWKAKLGALIAGILGPATLWVIYLLICSEILRSLQSADLGVTVLGVSPHVLLNPYVMPYWITAVGIFAYCFLFVDVNRISLHTFDRDRLSRAYLFRRLYPQAAGPKRWWDGLLWLAALPVRAWRWFRHVAVSAPLPSGLLEHTDGLKLSDVSPTVGPFHLINATLNLHKRTQGSLRGRNAAFFTFSRLHAGGPVTRYAPTTLLERVDGKFNLGTAMAISGAAVAPVQGTATNPVLVFVLALLNVRLGYWLPNPGRLGVARGTSNALQAVYTQIDIWRVPGMFYLFSEATRRLSDTQKFVFLSDGGHLDNMGLYELLRRRCKFIILSDAEQDGDLHCSGLAQAIRLARIDFGIIVEIDLSQIKSSASSPTTQHCAFGRIYYGRDPVSGEDMMGELLYIKSSMTGDEDPYIASYKAEHPDFSHETTSDQFFDEAQFEAYRALGSHAIDKPSKVAASGPTSPAPNAFTVAQWLAQL